MIATGRDPHPPSNFVNKVEVIDLANSSARCKPWTDLSFDTWQASGGLFEDGLLVCGGGNNLDNWTVISDQCYLATPTSSQFYVSLKVEVKKSSSIVMDNRLFLTGGEVYSKYLRYHY